MPEDWREFLRNQDREFRERHYPDTIQPYYERRQGKRNAMMDLLNHSLNVVLERSVFQADAARMYAFVNWAGQ